VRVGGRAFYQGTVEYSFPLAVPEVRGVALFDFGDAEPRFSDFSTRRLRTAAGGGLRLRFRVPLLRQVVPVDFYWVQALAREREDDPRLFTFTIGFAF
jgi:outer membrane protein assembly factor BamA